MKDIFDQLPPARSTIAGDVDELFSFIFAVSVIFFVGIVATMAVLMFKYRKRPGHRAAPTPENHRLELFWTFSPLILLVIMFGWGFKVYMNGAIAPDGAHEVRVTGRQWDWGFEHVLPDGTACTEDGALTVPVGQPVKLIMTSSDVIHSFFVPEFRVKRDVVPGMYTTIWFEATAEGEYLATCAEYCGAPVGVTVAAGEANKEHSSMRRPIRVVSEQAFQARLTDLCRGREPSVEYGRELYQQKGCVGCHQSQGAVAQPAPNFAGLFGREERMSDGTTVTVDEEYIRESIVNPNAKKVAGYDAIPMPPFPLKDNEIQALTMFIRSLNGP